MHKLFCPAKNISGDKAVLKDKAQLHHLKDVLRIKPGETITIFDGQGNDYLCLVEEVDKDKVLVGIKEKKSTARQMQITIACAIPKKAKMDEIIDKLTQLGVDRIVPLITEG